MTRRDWRRRSSSPSTPGCPARRLWALRRLLRLSPDVAADPPEPKPGCGRVLSAPGARTPPCRAAHVHPHRHPPDRPPRLTLSAPAHPEPPPARSAAAADAFSTRAPGAPTRPIGRRGRRFENPRPRSPHPPDRPRRLTLSAPAHPEPPPARSASCQDACVFDVLANSLAGSLVRLERLEQWHAEDLRAACADPRVSQWLPVPLHEPRWFDWWLADGLAARAERREVAFATVRRADGLAVGSTRFFELRERDRSVEIGWTWLSPAAWGTGANVEAKLLMLGRAFDEAGCIRVELKTDARNERSRAAMTALPAQFEGIHRQHRVLLDDSYRDSAWYSVIDREWPDVRANLERRLLAARAA